MKIKDPVYLSLYNVMLISVIKTTYDTPKTSASELAQCKFSTLKTRQVGRLMLIKIS